MSFANQTTFPTVETGQETVTTAGTAVQLNGGTTVYVPNGASVAVRADGGNAGSIYVGDSNVSSSNGFVLGASESVSLPVDNVAAIYIDADNDGEGVSWITEVDE